MKMRRSPQTVQVLVEFLRRQHQWRYGYEMSRNTGLKSGTLYPILMRLAEHQMLETSWEETEVGRPPRHMYRLTRGGLRFARSQVSTTQAMTTGKPVFEGAAS
jgi:PadR family transcriptional regulator PadR